MKFDIGDRVTFVNNKTCYTIGPNNPLVGTVWECQGKIVEIMYTSIKVNWDNDTQNTYQECDLTLICPVGQPNSTSNPNRLFKQCKGGFL